MSGTHGRALGYAGEDRAADHLQRLGYVLLARNFTVRGGELDIVALDGECLVFVEVKQRRRSSPEDALSAKKAARLRKAASAYRRANDAEDMAFRFDLIAIEGNELRHHRDVLSDP